METLRELGGEIFLECSPKPILLGMGRECLSDMGVWLPSLRPGHSDWQQMLASLSELYVRGVKVDWVGFDLDYPQRQKVTLPTYPFERQRYWIETESMRDKSSLEVDSLRPDHPLLGRKLSMAGSQLYFESRISSVQPNYLEDHRVFERVLFPTAAYLEMALAAGHHLFEQSFTIEEFSIERGLFLEASKSIRVQTVISQNTEQSYSFEIFSPSLSVESGSEGEWQRHSRGIIRVLAESSASIDSLAGYQAECPQPCEKEEHYRHCQERHIEYGNSFQGLEHLWRGTDKALGQVQLPGELGGETADYWFHPVLLDVGLQVLGALEDERRVRDNISAGGSRKVSGIRQTQLAIVGSRAMGAGK